MIEILCSKSSITLPRPSRKGNPANDVDLKTCLNKKGCRQRAKEKERAVCTEASTRRGENSAVLAYIGMVD